MPMTAPMAALSSSTSSTQLIPRSIPNDDKFPKRNFQSTATTTTILHPPPQPPRLPPRTKTTWDCVLEEMKWMAIDFHEERKWKVALGKSISNDIQKEFSSNRGNNNGKKKRRRGLRTPGGGGSSPRKGYSTRKTTASSFLRSTARTATPGSVDSTARLLILGSNSKETMLITMMMMSIHCLLIHTQLKML